MAMPKEAPPNWITGEEYVREWERLHDLGRPYGGPEYAELERRIDARDEYLWEKYAVPLMDRYPGKWIAVLENGDFLMAETDLEVMEQADERFGAGFYCMGRLTPDRGAERLLSPRSG